MLKSFTVLCITICIIVSMYFTQILEPQPSQPSHSETEITSTADYQEQITNLRDTIKELESEITTLEKSHSRAIRVNQDLDRRLSIVEGRYTP